MNYKFYERTLRRFIYSTQEILIDRSTDEYVHPVMQTWLVLATTTDDA